MVWTIAVYAFYSWIFFARSGLLVFVVVSLMRMMAYHVVDYGCRSKSELDPFRTLEGLYWSKNKDGVC